jgi:hypothetical protein
MAHGVRRAFAVVERQLSLANVLSRITRVRGD